MNEIIRLDVNDELARTGVIKTGDFCFRGKQNDNEQALRLVKAIGEFGGQEKAQVFEEQFPLSKSADINKKYVWAKSACSFLEKQFDEETIYKIRKECRCNDGKSIADKLSKYLKKSNNIEDFVVAFNQNETFAFLEYISEHKILFCYPTCYCACVKRVSEQLSKTWCYCTLGNAEGIFTEVFKKDVKVSLLESIKTGADRCTIQVEW